MTQHEALIQEAANDLVRTFDNDLASDLDTLWREARARVQDVDVSDIPDESMHGAVRSDVTRSIMKAYILAEPIVQHAPITVHENRGLALSGSPVRYTTWTVPQPVMVNLPSQVGWIPSKLYPAVIISHEEGTPFPTPEHLGDLSDAPSGSLFLATRDLAYAAPHTEAIHWVRSDHPVGSFTDSLLSEVNAAPGHQEEMWDLLFQGWNRLVNAVHRTASVTV